MIDKNLLNKLYTNVAKAQKISKIVQEDPYYVRPIVTQQDASNGFVHRYFVRPVNQTEFIVEVDQGQYSNFKKNPRFLTVELRWKIKGKIDTIVTPYGARLVGVSDYNRKLVTDADLTFGGLRRYIVNYSEFWVAEA